MNQFGRCQIGSEFFGSVISSWHKKSSYILAKFMTNNGIDCYPGQIQYFFTHTVDLPSGASEHYLAYVRWYMQIQQKWDIILALMKITRPVTSNCDVMTFILKVAIA